MFGAGKSMSKKVINIFFALSLTTFSWSLMPMFFKEKDSKTKVTTITELIGIKYRRFYLEYLAYIEFESEKATLIPSREQLLALAQEQARSQQEDIKQIDYCELMPIGRAVVCFSIKTVALSLF